MSLKKLKTIENMQFGNCNHELTNGSVSVILFYGCNKFVTNVN